jgi:acetamidase/formamidase
MAEPDIVLKITSHGWLENSAEAAMKFGTAALLALLTAGQASAADVSGEWHFSAQVLDDVNHSRVTLKADGEKLTGTLNDVTLAGTLKGDELAFVGTRPNGQRFGEFKGRVSGDQLTGTASWPGLTATVSWVAKRQPKRPEAPRTHRFEPSEFHRVFSDAIPPVLHVFPGDTVSTWTIDAAGVDSKGIRRSQGGNPETGPFYIEGAMPGDTLVVKLNKVRLNRDSAISSGRIASTALNPAYVERTRYQDDFESNWILDRTNGIGRLKSPSEHLKSYTVKLQPMLGCVAVAPPGHQALRSAYPGPFGGNMDYNQTREGTTIYLPVFVPGALLFIGDGHAAQGDGELTGNALETSMDVEFTVELVTGRATGGPRAENDDYLMSSGIGNSLADALQLATTQLVNWLQTDYKLAPNEAAVVLGTAMRYDIAEVVDPLVHVVAKIRKDAVAQLK